MDSNDLTCEICFKVFANGESLLRHLKKREGLTTQYLNGSPAHEMAKGEMRVRISEYRLERKRRYKEQQNTQTQLQSQCSAEPIQQQQEQQNEQQVQQLLQQLQVVDPQIRISTDYLRMPFAVRSAAIQRVAIHLKVYVHDLIVPVPPDGLCLSYCFTASKNRERFMYGRQLNGFRNAQHSIEAELEKKHASAFLKRVLIVLRADNQHVMATRLELNGSDGYPGQDELPWFAKAGKCIVHLYSLESDFADLPMVISGDSGHVISIGHMNIMDGCGHESSHFVLLNTCGS